jgi:cell division transport system permease protein
MIATLAYFARSAVGSLWRAPFVHLTAVAALTLALVGFCAARVVHGQLSALAASLGGEVEFTVYAKPFVTPEQLSELEAALVARTQGVARRVSPAEALKRLSTELALEAMTPEVVGADALPWSVELSLPVAERGADKLANLAQRARELPYVERVDFGELALDRLNVVRKALDVASWVVFALVFLTAIVVVSATLQLAIFARREEIEIQKLVGATDRFVRAPFLLEGLLEGLLAALLAVGSVWFLVYLVERGYAGPVKALALGGRVTVQWARLSFEVMAAGALLGLLGSFVAVRRFLTV